MGHVAEPPPRPGESEGAYLRRVIAWHHGYSRELAWQSGVAVLGIPVLMLLVALLGS